MNSIIAPSDTRFSQQEAEVIRAAIAWLLRSFNFAVYAESRQDLQDAMQDDATNQAVLGALGFRKFPKPRTKLIALCVDSWLAHELTIRARLACHRLGCDGEEPERYLSQ